MIYQWKLSPSQFPVAAQDAGECLERLRVRSNGHLTPRAVVDEARSEASPLHPAFEWNDATAAEAYRETQAKDILRSIVVRLPERQKRRGRFAHSSPSLSSTSPSIPRSGRRSPTRTSGTKSSPAPGRN